MSIQSFIITLIICSLSMSVLALLYMACTPFLGKRYSEKGRYYAWLIILVGLIIPFRPQLGNPLVSVELPIDTPQIIVQTVGNAPNIIFPTISVSPLDSISTNMPPVSDVVSSGTLVDTTLDVSWWQVAMLIWLGGLIVFIAFQSIKHYRFTKMTRRWSTIVTDEWIVKSLDSLREDMGIIQQIPIYLCKSVGSPMLMGVTNPRILLPTFDLAHDEMRFILKHELVHHKRKDILYKILILIATALHWFNPVVYLMARAINLLCETSCDAEVLQSANTDARQSYGETIIGVIQYKSRKTTALSTYFYGGKNNMSNRISSIMDTRKKKFGMFVIGVIILSMVAVGSIFAVQAQSNGAYTHNNDESANLSGFDILDDAADQMQSHDGTVPIYHDGNISGLEATEDSENAYVDAIPFVFETPLEFLKSLYFEMGNIKWPTYLPDDFFLVEIRIWNPKHDPSELRHFTDDGCYKHLNELWAFFSDGSNEIMLDIGFYQPYTPQGTPNISRLTDYEQPITVRGMAGILGSPTEQQFLTLTLWDDSNGDSHNWEIRSGVMYTFYVHPDDDVSHDVLIMIAESLTNISDLMIAFNEPYIGLRSPYRIATTIEEVRAIIALQDGTIPLTNVDVPEIRSGHVDGIIILEQCLYEALDELHQAYAQNGYPIRNLVTSRVAMSPRFHELPEPYRSEWFDGLPDNMRMNHLTSTFFHTAIDIGIISMPPGGWHDWTWTDEEVEIGGYQAQRLIALYDGDFPSYESIREATQLIYGWREVSETISRIPDNEQISDSLIPLSDFGQFGFDVEWHPNMSMGMGVLRRGNLEIIAINMGHGIAVNYHNRSMTFSSIIAPQIVDGVLMLPYGSIDDLLEALDLQ